MKMFIQVELGANWIHGVLGNPMVSHLKNCETQFLHNDSFIKFEIATAHGLINIINVPKPHKICCLTEEGKQVPFPILQDIYEGSFHTNQLVHSSNNEILFIRQPMYVSCDDVKNIFYVSSYHHRALKALANT